MGFERGSLHSSPFLTVAAVPVAWRGKANVEVLVPKTGRVSGPPKCGESHHEKLEAVDDAVALRVCGGFKQEATARAAWRSDVHVKRPRPLGERGWGPAKSGMWHKVVGLNDAVDFEQRKGGRRPAVRKMVVRPAVLLCRGAPHELGWDQCRGESLSVLQPDSDRQGSIVMGYAGMATGSEW